MIDHGGPNANDGAHFLIGCEARTEDDEPVGDYYQEFIREHVDENGTIQTPLA